MLQDSETVRDTTSDLDVTVTAAYEDPTVQEFLDDVYRNEAALTDQDLEQMHAAAAADGLDAAPFHDLTPERHAELMKNFPVGRGWMPVIGYDASAAKPFTAELRRGTPNGPDIAKLGSYLSAECALFIATCFGHDMAIADAFGDEDAKAKIRAKIAYAAKA